MKRILITSLVVVGLMVFLGSAVMADISDGLVLYFTFDNDSGAKVMDQSGTGNNGDIIGGANIVAGKFGKGIEFDGKTQFVLVPSSATLNLTDAVTMAAWINPSTPAVSCWLYYLISKWNYHAGNGRCYMLGLLDQAANGVTLFISRDGTDATMTRLDAGAVEYGANKWLHIASIYNGSTVKTYINGVEVGSMDATGKIFVDENVDAGFSVGAGSSGKELNAMFTGLVDEVAIYNRALSVSELTELMNKSVESAVNSTGKLTTTWGNLKY
jgi:hypothetical protein